MRIGNKKLVVILAVLLVLAVGYIIVDKVQRARTTQLLTTYRQGYQQGLIDTVLTLYQQTEKCQTTTINTGNATRRVVDVTCLQGAG